MGHDPDWDDKPVLLQFFPIEEGLSSQLSLLISLIREIREIRVKNFASLASSRFIIFLFEVTHAVHERPPYRALLAYLTVEEIGHKATDVARILGIKRVSVHQAAKKGERVLENLPSPL